jgi:AcrR family transcriptional regulator
MTRTYKKHDTRKGELLETARKLFYSKGYDSTSVEDIINTAEVSKGAFYHHFTSKEELLDCMVKQITDHIIDEISIIVKDTSFNGLEKLHKVADIGRMVKFSNKDLLKTYLKVVYTSDNMVLRLKMNTAVTESMVPLYASIIEQGIKEGFFNTPSPAFSARMIMVMGIGLQEMIWRLFVNMNEDSETVSTLCHHIDLYEDTLERLLGAPKGSLDFLNEEDIRKFLKE